jgi:hypothetical protein
VLRPACKWRIRKEPEEQVERTHREYDTYHKVVLNRHPPAVTVATISARQTPLLSLLDRSTPAGSPQAPVSVIVSRWRRNGRVGAILCLLLVEPNRWRQVAVGVHGFRLPTAGMLPPRTLWKRENCLDR